MVNIKNNKGISLVALVITIIVLLILAGISLSFAFGETGIITKAKKSAEITNLKQAQETVELKIADLQSEKDGKATIKDISEIENDDIEVIFSSSYSSTVDIAYQKKYIFTINSHLKISESREYSENTLSKITPIIEVDNL